MALKALRGATTVTTNSAEEIGTASVELVRELLERNGLGPDEVVSMIFTMTPDLDAAFPAEAVRNAGLGDAALLCAQEIPVPGALPRCIRVLAHLEGGPERCTDVYLRDAVSLRQDR